MQKRSISSLLLITYVAAIATTSLLSGCVSKDYAPLPTVEKVDLQRYIGKWYQVSFIPNRFQSMCVADTQAEYQADGKNIRVINRCRKADQSIEQANGVAEVVDGSNNSKLRVSFFRPFYGNYWVLDLDPEYRWVLVGEPSREYGWILSRTPSLDQETLNKVLDKAVSLGYDRSLFKADVQSNPLN